ncbi:MAG: hypothetical protein MR016_06925, partial [Agathobacter sp.]|nr:hypothetical protein [Agathobacter sp.]
MKTKDTNMDKEKICSMTNSDEEVTIRDEENDKKQRNRIDRSTHKYSEEAFLRLPRAEQLALAEKYWNGPVDHYDDERMFQFSYSHLAELCKRIGFRKGVVVDRADEVPQEENIIYIDHGKRSETVEKKITLSQETEKMLDELLGNKLSNIERSKVIDAIFRQALVPLL